MSSSKNALSPKAESLGMKEQRRRRKEAALLAQKKRKVVVPLSLFGVIDAADAWEYFEMWAHERVLHYLAWVRETFGRKSHASTWHHHAFGAMAANLSHMHAPAVAPEYDESRRAFVITTLQEYCEQIMQQGVFSANSPEAASSWVAFSRTLQMLKEQDDPSLYDDLTGQWQALSAHLGPSWGDMRERMAELVASLVGATEAMEDEAGVWSISTLAPEATGMTCSTPLDKGEDKGIFGFDSSVKGDDDDLKPTPANEIMGFNKGS